MKSFNHSPKIFKSPFYILLICFLTSSTVIAQLSRTESKIIAKAQAYDQESIDFLEKMVNINSGTLNLAGVKKVGMLNKQILKK